MGLLPDIKITINNHGTDPAVMDKLNKLMAQIDDLKAKIEAQNAQLDTITESVTTANTALTGVQDDIAYLKTLVAGNPTPEQWTEVNTALDAMGSKIGNAASSLSALATGLSGLDGETTRPEEPTD